MKDLAQRSSEVMEPWYVYIIISEMGIMYTGISNDPEKRLLAHNNNKGAKFTKGKQPWHIIGLKACSNKSEASKLEIKTKKLSAQEKKRWANDNKYWKLWLDDQAEDVELPRRHAPVGWISATSSEAAKALVEANGAPYIMDLDHDLGEGDDALMFLRWLADTVAIPPKYLVHSMNPIGRERIVSFMECWKKEIS